jgi:hypothetical protein
MSHKRMGFRLVIFTGVMMILAAVQPLGQRSTIGPILPQAFLDPGSEILEGTWSGEVVGTATRTLYTFSRGGGMTAENNLAAPELRKAFQGTWANTGRRQFLVTMVRFQFDSAGNFDGTLKIRNLVTVNETLDGFSGQAINERFDRNGNLVLTQRPAVRAVRLNAEPLQ